MHDWLGYALLYVGFATGAAVGGLVGLVVSGAQMLAAATVIAGATTVVTYRQADDDVSLLG